MKKTLSRILAIFCVIVLLFTNASCSYDNLEPAYQTKITSYSQQFMHLLGMNISNEAEKVQGICLEVSLSKEVQDGLRGLKKMNSSQKKELSIKIADALMSKLIFVPELVNAGIITNAGELFSCSASKLNDQKELIAEATGQKAENSEPSILNKKETVKNIIKNAEAKKGKVAWEMISNGKKNSILCYKEIKDITSGSKLGVLVIELKESYFSKVTNKVDLGADSNIFIIDSKGSVILSQDQDIKCGKLYPDSLLVQNVTLNNQKAFIRKIKNEDNIVAYSYIDILEWYVVGNVPLSEFD